MPSSPTDDLARCLVDLERGDEAARLKALWALQRSPHEWQMLDAPVSAVTSALRDGSARVRALAAACAGVTASIPVTAIVPLLDDPEQPTRLAAGRALLRRDRPAAIAALRQRIADRGDEEKLAILAIAARAQAHEIVAGTNLLAEGSPDVRRAVVELLTIALASGDDSALPALTGALDDNDVTVRRGALLGLAMVSERVPSEVFLRELASPTAFVRAASVSALGRSGLATVCDAVRPLLDDPEPTVRRAAIRAIGRLRCAGAREALLDRATASEPEAGELAVLVGALAELGGLPSDLVESASVHPAASVRAATVRALGLREAKSRFAVENDLAVRAELVAALHRLDPGGVPAPTGGPFVDPRAAGQESPTSNVGIWLVDPGLYPASSRVVFYNLGVVEVFDVDGVHRVRRFSVEGDVLAVRSDDGSERRVRFSITPGVEHTPHALSRGFVADLEADPFFGSPGRLHLFCATSASD
jgi:HEAT repeat protein